MLLVKVGGGKNINWDGVCRNVRGLLENEKEKIVVVHGANAEREVISNRLGVPVKTVESPSGITSVYTDQEAMDIFLMAYAGLTNKKIVACFQRHGVNAVGISGVDGRLWQAKQKSEILAREGDKVMLLKGNLSGKVERINVNLINLLLESNYVPVICPPAISYENNIVNTDSDGAMAAMAEALGIQKMVSLFEAPGLLRDPEDKGSVIRHIPKGQIDEYLQFAQGRMKKKILGAKSALEGGMEIIYWGDGRIQDPLRSALQGNGTVIS